MYMGLSIRTKGYRYTRWVKFDKQSAKPMNWDDTNPLELYDYQSDPGENVNVAGSADHAVEQGRLDLILKARSVSDTLSEWEAFLSQNKRLVEAVS